MKKIFFALVVLFQVTLAEALMCGPGQMVMWTQSVGYVCVNRFTSPTDTLPCMMTTPPVSQWYESFPAPFFQPNLQSWWAQQGNIYYPNLSYPGAWQYPGMQSHYYPGNGGVFAAKPNVYIESIHEDKKFDMAFVSEGPLHFLATTPVLEKNAWNGKIKKDKFEVEGIFYDYLFYDIRLPQEKMQFEQGLCATREAAISWMLKDLETLKHSSHSLQDFEEHWSVKIPSYPFYCIYPQYNKQLDPALPVAIKLDQATFMRSLYVLVPYKEEPDADTPQIVPFPVKEPEDRPSVQIKRENNFREWGVAFLESPVIP